MKLSPGVHGPLSGHGVREDDKRKGLYTFTPIIQEFRGPPVVPNDTLRVNGSYS